jgi:hypothetical protein
MSKTTILSNFAELATNGWFIYKSNLIQCVTMCDGLVIGVTNSSDPRRIISINGDSTKLLMKYFNGNIIDIVKFIDENNSGSDDIMSMRGVNDSRNAFYYGDRLYVTSRYHIDLLCIECQKSALLLRILKQLGETVGRFFVEHDCDDGDITTRRCPNFTIRICRTMEDIYISTGGRHTYVPSVISKSLLILPDDEIFDYVESHMDVCCSTYRYSHCGQLGSLKCCLINSEIYSYYTDCDCDLCGWVHHAMTI